MLTSKQRAALRAIANNTDTIFQIGKDGIGENLIKQVADALKVREIVKIKLLETAFLTIRDVADELSEATKSEVVQIIGTRIVLYKENKTIPKEKRLKV